MKRKKNFVVLGLNARGNFSFLTIEEDIEKYPQKKINWDTGEWVEHNEIYSPDKPYPVIDFSKIEEAKELILAIADPNNFVQIYSLVFRATLHTESFWVNKGMQIVMAGPE